MRFPFNISISRQLAVSSWQKYLQAIKNAYCKLPTAYLLEIFKTRLPADRTESSFNQRLRPIRKLISILFFIWYVYPAAFAQNNHASVRPGATKKIGTVVTAMVIDGDTIPVVNLQMFRVVGQRKFKNEKQKRRFNRLKRDVKIVYPYAKLAGKKLRKYNDELADIKNEGKRKRFMRKVEKELKEEFGDELKNLTIRQGAILIRLVDRETGDTSYELVKELRGTFSAFFWQGLARIFGQNLKNQYDPSGDQKMIEEIVLLIEAGDL